jgi:hypothetical protein
MKPTVALLFLGVCACFLSATSAPGYYNTGWPVTDIFQPAVFDTAITIPSMLVNKGAAVPLPKIIPQPGSKLNYTQIMFEHPQIAGAEEYLVEVALNDGNNLFTKPIIHQTDSSTAVMLSNFEFGKKYIWRYTGLHNQNELGWNGPYNFEILNGPAVDEKSFRIRVLQNDSTSEAGGLIVLDMSGNIIDRSGKFVWYLPIATQNEPDPHLTLNDTGTGFRSLENFDMRITPIGTVTFLNGARAEERDLNANLIWKAPYRHDYHFDSLNTGLPYRYHHGFKRLSNGNFMVLDKATFIKSKAQMGSQNAPAEKSTDTGSFDLAYEIIKEFDKMVTWYGTAAQKIISISRS